MFKTITKLSYSAVKVSFRGGCLSFFLSPKAHCDPKEKTLICVYVCVYACQGVRGIEFRVLRTIPFFLSYDRLPKMVLRMSELSSYEVTQTNTPTSEAQKRGGATMESRHTRIHRQPTQRRRKQKRKGEDEQVANKGNTCYE